MKGLESGIWVEGLGCRAEGLGCVLQFDMPLLRASGELSKQVSTGDRLTKPLDPRDQALGFGVRV